MCNMTRYQKVGGSSPSRRAEKRAERRESSGRLGSLCSVILLARHLVVPPAPLRHDDWWVEIDRQSDWKDAH